MDITSPLKGLYYFPFCRHCVLYWTVFWLLRTLLQIHLENFMRYILFLPVSGLLVVLFSKIRWAIKNNVARWKWIGKISYLSYFFCFQLLDYRLEFSRWWNKEMRTIKYPSSGTVFDYFIDPDTKKFTPWTERIPDFDMIPDIPLQVCMHLSIGRK